MRTDPRFHDWVPDESTQKGDLLMHLDYAHENQSRRDYYKWMANYQYFLKRFTRTELIKIHDDYHADAKRK